MLSIIIKVNNSLSHSFLLWTAQRLISYLMGVLICLFRFECMFYPHKNEKNMLKSTQKGPELPHLGIKLRTFWLKMQQSYSLSYHVAPRSSRSSLFLLQSKDDQSSVFVLALK